MLLKQGISSQKNLSRRSPYLISNIVVIMAFISSERCPFASNLWPQAMGNLILHHNKQEGSNTVPTVLEEMLSWASVERDPNYDGIPVALCLVYKEALPVVNPISVHLYGFLEEFNLRPFGNWNG